MYYLNGDVKIKMKEYKIIQTNKLRFSGIREIRENIKEEIKKNIQENGYYEARVLAVVPDSEDYYLVADGNHRLNALRELGIKEVPCLVYEKQDIYTLAIEGNNTENTYAPMDLFDWLGIIQQLKEQGLTQQEIGDKIGWSREQIKNYIKIIKTIGTQILDLCKEHQIGRVPEKGTIVPFDFTEGWFRNSGLYDLNEEHQLQTIKWFIKEKVYEQKTNKNLKIKTKQFKEIEDQIELINKFLDPSIDTADLLIAVEKGEYSTERLKDVIETLNKGAKNQFIFGVDCREELKKMETNSIDCIVTDPPWGVEYKPSRKTENPEYDLSLEDALKLFDDVMRECKRICKENAHLYIFFPTMFYREFKEILERYFQVYPIPLIWYKNNHNPCDFKQRYASIYETIFFCKMENGNLRELNYKVSPDIIPINKIKDKIHDSEKPIELLEYLILNSSGEQEIILDPFMGSGNTLLAAAKNNRNYIGYELDKTYESNFRKKLGDLL